MMGRSHLAVNGAVAVVGITWLGILRDPGRVPARTLDGWVHGSAARATGLLGRDVPAWASDHAVSDLAQRAWDWLWPVWGSSVLIVAAYVVGAVALLWLGSLLPDADSRMSALGRRLPFRMPGPHRGLLHTDWFLIALFAVSVVPFARLVFWVWLGAWLHCELDGMSTAGRVRFYPMTKYRVLPFPNGELCIGRVGRHVGLYRAGSVGEWALLVGLLGACGTALSAAALL